MDDWVWIDNVVYNYGGAVFGEKKGVGSAETVGESVRVSFTCFTVNAKDR